MAAKKKASKKAPAKKKSASKRKPNAAFMKAMQPSSSLAAVIGAWSRVDAPAAAAYLQQTPAGPLRVSLIEKIAGTWPENDSAGAAEWVNSLAEPRDKAQAASYIIQNVARANPKAAASFLDATSYFGPGYTLPWTAVGEQWAKSDVQGAVNWMNEIPDEKLKRAVFSSLAGEWAASDPATSRALSTVDKIAETRAPIKTMYNTVGRVSRA